MRVTQEQLLAQQIQPDIFLADFDLHLRQTFYPLGFPLQLETNSPDVIAAAEEGWGGFSQQFERAPLRISLAVTNSDEPLLTMKSVFAMREHLASIYADAGNFAVCDFRQDLAFGWVTRGLAADHPLLRYRFLTPISHMLAGQRDLAPLHGALIAKDGVGVMLCGESMAGKSTLAYACCRAGWSYITDDGTSLVRTRPDRYAVGDFTSIRLREDAIRFFPELADRAPVVRANGKIALEIRSAELPIASLPGHSIDHVVFLDRQDSERVSLRSYSRELALEEWDRHAAYGLEAVRGEQKQCYRRLLNAGRWGMRYSRLADAIDRLERLVETGA
jgi:hypothetical protein